MIKINLIPGQVQEGAFLGGIDISLVNWKLFFVFTLLAFIPQCGLELYWGNQLETMDREISDTRGKIAIEQKKIDELKEVKKQVDDLKKKESALQGKLKVVQEVVSIRKNPMKILHYLALNMPSDVWITELQIENDKMLIKGNAVDYKSIGIFIDNLKNAVFFEKQVNLDDYSTEIIKDTEQRVEEFQISAKILRYD